HADVPLPGAMAAAIASERDRLSFLAPHITASASRELHEALAHVEEQVLDGDDTDLDQVQRTNRDLQDVQKRIDDLEDAQRLPMKIASAREESEMTNQAVLAYGSDGHKARVYA